MARIKTFVNGSRLFPEDLNNIQDDYEDLYAQYKRFGPPAGEARSGFSQFSDQLMAFMDRDSGSFVGHAGASVDNWALYLDPAWFAAGDRGVVWRMRTTCAVGGTPPAVTFTIALCPVILDSYGAQPVVFAVDPAVATATFTTPAAASITNLVTSDFALDAGYYTFVLSNTGTVATDSVCALNASLEYRQVDS